MLLPSAPLPLAGGAYAPAGAELNDRSAACSPGAQLGNFIGRPVRLVLFWKEIRWEIVKYYLPASLFGAFLGAWLLSSFQSKTLQLIIGLFLVSTLFQYRFGKRQRSFEMKLWYFMPLGLLIPFISTVTGALGPLLNPFLLNYNMKKEELIATKTFNSFFAGVVQIGSYSFFGALYGKLWWWGLSLGLGIGFGNYFGKRLLSKITEASFRRWAIAFMVISGVVMVIKAFWK
ncbi:MAG: sulfite exporter TauE/SafE family protein [Owenweeksia sp.]|nr:sulfite exporter TauE/SafE family protein [Owenweeksia sp.]